LPVATQDEPWQKFQDKPEQWSTDPPVPAHILLHRTHVDAHLFYAMAELHQAEDLTLHEYDNANHDRFNWGDTPRGSFIVYLFPRDGEVHAEDVEHTVHNLGGTGVVRVNYFSIDWAGGTLGGTLCAGNCSIR
jgi:hypothetical protein